ncbi:MAG: HlyD family type I secretion periplasmic adaptor subunit [Limnobacter sp.]|jgi:membrane fusion protein, protease secretion system|uniref:HlyD family type I secretion periplasmic adaptor subunit n=1 Tax=Limnobacter sp. TaxID=2003368 RepID=UPI0040376B46
MHNELDIKKVSRRGLVTLIVGFIGFVGWGSLVAMDRGVVVNGTLTFHGERKTIVHPHGGVIEKIWITEGQLVQQGQTLISLNTTDSQTQLNALQVQRQALIAKTERLEKETGNDLGTTTKPETTGKAADPFQTRQHEAEAMLYASRQRALQNDIRMLELESSTAQNNMTAQNNAQRSKQQQLERLKRQHLGMADMVAKGYMPANRLVELQGQISALEVALAQDEIQISQLNATIRNAKLKKQQLHNQLHTESQTVLADVQAELAALDEQIQRIAFVVQHTNIQSPVAGQVLGLRLFTQGSAMPANTPIMDIAPNGSKLEISAELEPAMVDQVKAEQPVTVRFSALKTAQTLEVEGVLNRVGADQLSNPTTGMPYIPVNVRLTQKALEEIAQHRIQAGVPVELLIVTGEQTLMQYLFKPITDRLFSAMREH